MKNSVRMHLNPNPQILKNIENLTKLLFEKNVISYSWEQSIHTFNRSISAIATEK